MTHDECNHRRDHHGPVDAILLDRGHDLLRLELRHEYRRATCGGDAEDGASRAGPAVIAGRPPESELEIDEDFLRKIRDA